MIPIPGSSLRSPPPPSRARKGPEGAHARTAASSKGRAWELAEDARQPGQGALVLPARPVPLLDPLASVEEPAAAATTGAQGRAVGLGPAAVRGTCQRAGKASWGRWGGGVRGEKRGEGERKIGGIAR